MVVAWETPITICAHLQQLNLLQSVSSLSCAQRPKGDRGSVMQKDFAQNFDEDLNVTDSLRQCASCAVIVFDGARISQFTPDAALLTGVKMENASGKKIDVLPEALREIFQKTFSSGQPVSTQIKLPQVSGGESSLQVTTTPLGANGKISGVVAVLNDFSCAEKLAEKLERIDRLASIGTLSASMAHEIKNALVAVKTFLDLLLARNTEDELAGIVGREMTRIDSIVSQMLTFSGPAKPILVPIRLHDILNHSIKLVQHQIGQKNIALERAFAAAPDVVKGDDYQLKQAFLNLFLNALEAMPANGKLIIATELTEAESEGADALREKAPGKLRVTICDSGVGIKPENLARVFEPFFTTKPKGTGLGLSITRRIILEHRANISVESQPNKGSTFNIVFSVFRKP